MKQPQQRTMTAQRQMTATTVTHDIATS